jgi:hypothetical protein
MPAHPQGADILLKATRIAACRCPARVTPAVLKPSEPGWLRTIENTVCDALSGTPPRDRWTREYRPAREYGLRVRVGLRRGMCSALIAPLVALAPKQPSVTLS